MKNIGLLRTLFLPCTKKYSSKYTTDFLSLTNKTVPLFDDTTGCMQLVLTTVGIGQSVHRMGLPFDDTFRAVEGFASLSAGGLLVQTIVAYKSLFTDLSMTRVEATVSYSEEVAEEEYYRRY